ncbi:universal stress protein [Citreimonas salinaria]|uniref:Nucleotide-binding universal stress protein, UspA family n=1 Tax=Citreimonas salinaria TaxID=321339 RepID=A0A1H3LLS7_9RHOB|nr:universal stress protein [Citreimonas salinaria]SDY64805.1 Nucleotide-binding universal stress protein, UspA family [Citreimonas salinaria]
MFKHILVPVDGSINSFAALDKAVGLAGLTGAVVSILTIYRHHSLLEASLSMVRPQDPRRFDDVMREYAKEIAEKAKAHALAAGAAEVHAFVRNGAIARGIVAFAKDREVDLIVMGGRGVGSAENYMLGSISHKVASLTQRPVMIV